MPSINAPNRTRLRVPVRAVSTRPLPLLEFVSLRLRSLLQRVFEIAAERSGSPCALVSSSMSSWSKHHNSAARAQRVIPVESKLWIPAERSREAHLSGLRAVERQRAAI